MRAETREAIRLAIVARYGESGCERATDEIHTLVDADAAAQAAHHRKLVDDTAHVYEEVVRLRAEAAQTRALTTALERVLAYAPQTYYRDATKVWCQVCDSPAADSPETMPHTDDCPVPVVRAALTGAPREPQ